MCYNQLVNTGREAYCDRTGSKWLKRLYSSAAGAVPFTINAAAESNEPVHRYMVFACLSPPATGEGTYNFLALWLTPQRS